VAQSHNQIIDTILIGNPLEFAADALLGTFATVRAYRPAEHFWKDCMMTVSAMGQ
jgi:hypothetical protein